jgi:hypothetical protein
MDARSTGMTKLCEHSAALADCVDRLAASLRQELAGQSVDVAIDASDMPAYATGRRDWSPAPLLVLRVVLVFRICAHNWADDVAEADYSDGPPTVGDRQMAEPISHHDARGSFDRRGLGNGDGLIRHPLPDWRLARLYSGRDRREEIAFCQDPNQSAGLHYESGPHASAGHLLRCLAEGVLGDDCEEIARH